MATTPTAPTLQKHHDGRSWTSYWRDDAKRLRTKRFGKEGEVSERQATARYNNWLKTEWHQKPHVQNPDSDPANYTATMLAKDYRAYADRAFVKNGKPTGHAYESTVAMNTIETAWGNRPLVTIEAHELAKLRDAMIFDADGKARGMKTVNGRLAIIKDAFRWAAIERGLIPETKAVAMKMVKPLARGRSAAKDPGEIKPIADAVVEATKQHLPPVLSDLITIQRLTGMRPGEACIMRTCDIDTTGDVWIYRPHTHKTEHKDKTREVAIGPKGQAIVEPRLLLDTRAYIFPPMESVKWHAQRAETHRRPDQKPSAKKTGRRVGDHYTKDSYRRAIHRACDSAFGEGVNRWSPNRLRHTWATEVRKLVGIEAASAGLGHATIDTTLIYAERSIETAKDVARRVG